MVERSSDGELTGDPPRTGCLAIQEGLIEPPDTQIREALRLGLRLANARGVTALHDQDGARGIRRLTGRN